MALLLLLGLNGCASQTQQDHARLANESLLTRSVEDLSAQHANDANRIDQLEQRVDALEQQSQQQNAQIDALSQALETFQSRHPVSASRNNRKNSPSTEKLVEKINQVEASLRQANPVVKADQAEEEKNVYTAAYLAWKSNRYDEASIQFAKFLEKYPQGEYSDQAWYWLGESLYAQHQNSKAFKAYDHVVRKYPDSVKYAASLLRMGQIYQDKKRPGDARAVLERLIREHGDTPSAAEARKILATMHAPGREK